MVLSRLCSGVLVCIEDIWNVVCRLLFSVVRWIRLLRKFGIWCSSCVCSLVIWCIIYS